MIRPGSLSNDVSLVIRGSDPKAKGRPRMGRWGMWTPINTRYYEAMIAQAAWMVFDGWIEPPIRVDGIGVFRRPKKSDHLREVEDYQAVFRDWKPDLDNLQKAILDGISGILFRDDAEVVWDTWRKVVAPKGGPCGILLRVRSFHSVLEKKSWKVIEDALSARSIGRVKLLSESGERQNRRVRQRTLSVASPSVFPSSF